MFWLLLSTFCTQSRTFSTSNAVLPVRRLGMHQELGGHTARTAAPSDQRGSLPSSLMLSINTELSSPQGWQLRAGHWSAGGEKLHHESFKSYWCSTVFWALALNSKPCFESRTLNSMEKLWCGEEMMFLLV